MRTLRLAASAALLIGSAAAPVGAQPNAPVIGRWDLTVTGKDGAYPSWLEVTLSGHRTLVGRFVGGGGSARPISRVTWDNGTVRFAIPPQWELATADLRAEATLAGDTLRGTLTTPMGTSEPFVGVRAPLLRRTAPPDWGTPVVRWPPVCSPCSSRSSRHCWCCSCWRWPGAPWAGWRSGGGARGSRASRSAPRGSAAAYGFAGRMTMLRYSTAVWSPCR